MTKDKKPSLFDPISIGEASSAPRWQVVRILMGITGQPLEALCRRLGINTDIDDFEKLASIGMHFAARAREIRVAKKRGRRSLEESGEDSINVRRAGVIVDLAMLFREDPRALAILFRDYPKVPRTQTDWIKKVVSLANNARCAPVIEGWGIRLSDFQGKETSIGSSVSAGLSELKRGGEEIPPDLFRIKKKGN